jgi:peptide/nickel transport system substrate-binding protein
VSFLGLIKVNSKALLYSTLLVVLFVAVACGSSATSTPVSSSTTTGAVPTATPASAGQPADGAVNAGKLTILSSSWGAELYTTWALGEVVGYNRQLHSYWMVGTKDVEITPGVATQWSISPDGLTWTFVIRDGIKFHNGEELTIDDALFTMENTYGPVAAAEGGPNVTAIAGDTVSIKAVGTNEIVVTHVRPLPFFPFVNTDMATNNNGALLPKAYFEEVGRDGYDANPIAAGPMKFVSHSFGDKMEFERFDDYWRPERLPKFQTLDLRLVPEVSTRVSALIGGQADIVDANLQVRDQVENSGNQIVTAKEQSYMWMFMPGCHREDLPCFNKEFRQAFDYAVDKELILNELYGPEAAEVKGWGFVFPKSLGYFEGLDPYPFDPEKARDLLAQAGYPGGEGLPKQIINTWDGAVPFLPEQAQLIAQMWRDNLGIEAEVKVGEEVATRERWFNGSLEGEWIFRDNEARWDAAVGINALYAVFDAAVHLGGKRDDLQAQVFEALEVVQPELRQAAMEKIYRSLQDEHYEWTTGIAHALYGVGPRVQGWEPWPLVAYLTALWTIDLQN